MKEREMWVDIAKGLGIVAVVVGHAPFYPNPTLYHYLFWFHMPLFFALSGYFHKPIASFSEIIKWTKKRTIQLLIPYATYSVLVFIFLSLTRDISLKEFSTQSLKVVYGGQMLTGAYGVFWFITCLLLTQILFAFIIFKIKSNIWQVSVISLMFIIAHIQTNFTNIQNLPWNIDVVLLAIFYYAFGYYFRKSKFQLTKHKPLPIIIFFSCISFIVLDRMNVIDYSLDMKNHIYNNLIFDLLIPVCFILAVFLISQKINNTFIAILGKMSLTIMYLHLPLYYLAIGVLGWSNFYSFAIIGIIIPITVHKLTRQFEITNLLFHGMQNKKTYNTKPITSEKELPE